MKSQWNEDLFLTKAEMIVKSKNQDSFGEFYFIHVSFELRVFDEELQLQGN